MAQRFSGSAAFVNRLAICHYAAAAAAAGGMAPLAIIIIYGNSFAVFTPANGLRQRQRQSEVQAALQPAAI